MNISLMEERVLRYVLAHPGCNKSQVTAAVSPQSSGRGNRAVVDAIQDGLIETRALNGPYQLHVTSFGADWIQG